MSELELAERSLGSTDAAQLRAWGVSLRRPELESLLDEALIVPTATLPADVVRLQAQVEIDVEEASGLRRQLLVLCPPEEAAPSSGRISVLSPIGLALIGLPVGATARWRSPAGQAAAARVVSVVPPIEP